MARLIKPLAVWLLVVATLAPASSRAQGAGTGSTAEITTTSEGGFKTWLERFRGTTFLVDQSLTVDTIFAGVQQSQVQSYTWWFSLRPRFYFTKTLSLRLRADLTIDARNGTDSTYKHEALLGDIWTDLVYTGIPTFGGINTSVGVRLLLPTSKTSQYRGAILGVGPTIGFNRPVPTRIGKLDFTLAGSANFSITRSATPSLQVAYPCGRFDFRSGDCDSLGGVNTFATLTGIVSASYSPVPRLTIGVSYVLIQQFLYSLGDATLGGPDGVPVDVGTSASDRRQRQYGWFLASVDVNATSWLELSLGYYVYRPILDPDSREVVGNPFWAPGGASRFFLTTTFGLDALYTAIAERRAGKASPIASVAPAPLRATF